MANASHKGMGEKGSGTGAGPADDARGALGETDIAGDLMGSNRLQANDQANVHNQRQGIADEKREADDGPVESARLSDKDARAEAELNKGGGVHPGMKQGGIS